MNTASTASTGFFSNWFVIAAIVFLVLFIFLLILWMFLDTGTGSFFVIILAVLFLFIAIGLFLYFWFFMSTTNPNNPNNPNNPTDTSVRFGDTILLRNTTYNLFASPCGRSVNPSHNPCGVAISLISDARFNQNNGNTTGLRKWMISGGTIGNVVKYGDPIQIVTLATTDGCDTCNNLPMGICGSNDRPEITSNPVTGTTVWNIISNSKSTGATVLYGDTLMIQNSTFQVMNSSGIDELVLLNTCSKDECLNDSSGTGCGLLVDVTVGSGGLFPLAINWVLQRGA